MKQHKTLMLALALLWPSLASADPVSEGKGALMVGVNLGELPWGGSFKPGVSIGYQLNDYAYAGLTYQLGDSIRRDEGSFNAKGIGLTGLQRSEEDVSHRFMASVRLRPHRLAPYASLGMVYNGRDTETSSYMDGTTVVQSRPSAFRPSVGIGYEYTLDNSVSLNVEWAGWVFAKPTPDVTLSGRQRSEPEEEALRERIDDNFKSHITNVYHMFSIGMGYAF